MRRSIGLKESGGRLLGLGWFALLNILLIAAVFLAIPAQAQESQQTTIVGTVSSVTGTSMLVKTTDGLFHLFNFDRNTTKPPMIPIGSEVRVVSYPSGSEGYRTAYVVTILRQGPVAGDTSAQTDVVPQEVRNIEHSLQRNAKKYHFGVSGGIALDPELVAIGLHTQFGPFFSRYLFFRPNVEFDWGEVTKMFGINAEVIYRVPISSQTNRWDMYVGGGPAFNFAEQSFSHNSGVDFSEFKYDAALNILVGLQYHSGVFAEVKSSIYASPAPSFRLIFGYNF